MDAHATQLRHQIEETRAAIDAQLTRPEQHVSQMPAAILEQTVGAPVRGVQEFDLGVSAGATGGRE